MKFRLISLFLAVSVLAGCELIQTNSHIERQIRSEVLKETAGIATLAAIYTLSFIHFEENLVTSDDFYIQKDIVNRVHPQIWKAGNNFAGESMRNG